MKGLQSNVGGPFQGGGIGARHQHAHASPWQQSRERTLTVNSSLVDIGSVGLSAMSPTSR
jgi:hypothetical protein